MINFKNASFVKSAPSLLDRPDKKLPEVLFVGRSNVGKSTLINSLTKRNNLAHTSSKPGFTKLLNYYLIDDKFYLVDAPGYGYTISGNRDLESFGEMMEDYFNNEYLKLVLFLVDSRHDLSNDDLDFLDFLKNGDINYLVINTKADKLNQKEKAAAIKRMKNLDISNYIFSSLNEKLDNLETKISSVL